MRYAKLLKYHVLNLIVLLTLFSCSKYEDGPLISFKSKSNRLINSWMYVTVLRNGNNITFVDTVQNYPASSIGFNDDNRFTQIDFTNQENVTLDGDWKFSQKKDSLILNYDDLAIERRLLIARLKSNSFQFEELIDNNLFEYDCFPNK